MEKSLHFGIDNNEIRKQYYYVMTLKFPEIPEEDELYDLFSELVELDGYVMGMVSHYLKTGSIDVSKLLCDSEFMEQYSQIKEEHSGLDEILRYKYELDKLINLFMKKN